jgi:hypothetical protein
MAKKTKAPSISLWLKGLAVAALGGASGAALDMVQAGQLDPKQIGKGALAGSILLTAGYLKQSPLK